MAEAEDWRLAIEPGATAFFLDVDGTLLGFKDRPEEVAADGALRDLLRRLQAAAGGALALMSGRTIGDLDRIMAPLELPAGGTHGAEMRWPDGRRTVADATSLAEIRPAVRAFVADREGLTMEDKGAAIAVHYRRVPTRRDEVARFLEGLVTGDLMVQHGKMVAEVKPRRNKGDAIRSFMEDAPYAGRSPLFIGDDLTDEHGFASVNAMGGVSIKVGPVGEPTVAHHRVAGVPNVFQLFEIILLRSAVSP